MDVLQDHYSRKIVAIKALEDVIGWQTNVRNKPKDMPIMDKVRANKIRVTIETWGTCLCDAVGSIIQDGHEACKLRWTTSKVSLDFLWLPMLELIEEAPSPKLKLDEVDLSFTAAKEQIEGVIQVNLHEIMKWIKTPSFEMVRIEVYVGKWKTMKKREIVYEILRVEIHLEHAKY